MKREGFTKLFVVWEEEFFALHPPFEGLILGKKPRIMRKHAL
jgi:hypothetical protein